ncbi:MAG: hypothetical protein EOO46_15295 [Flavobacterium sp.]|nr:MAG: hypothetical protein EOO46_15295 [Flavobacterium sp.]
MIKYLVTTIMVFNFCSAQKLNRNIVTGINTHVHEFNLKGPVKEVETSFFTNNDDRQNLQERFIYFNDVREELISAYKLYNTGLPLKSYNVISPFDSKANQFTVYSNNHRNLKNDSISDDTFIIDKFSSRTIYDSTDLEKKMKYNPKYSFIDHLGELEIKHDIYKLNVNKYVVERNEKSLYIHIYVYDFDAEGKVKKQKEYVKYYFDCVSYQDTLKMFNKSPEKYLSDKENLKFEWDYQYDRQERIVKLTMNNKEVGKDDSKINTRNKLIYEIDYNDFSKVEELRIFSTGTYRPEQQLNKTYRYGYHPKEGYLLYKEEILDSTYFYKWNFGGNAKYTDIQSKFHYDAYGNIIRREFLSDRSKEANAKKDPYEDWWRNPYAPRYYEYEYDRYNNWIKCRAYLRGVKTPKPSIVIDREITYYEDSE